MGLEPTCYNPNFKEDNTMRNERVNNFNEIGKIYSAPDKGVRKNLRRGDIYYIDKEIVYGSEQQGGRPGIIVSNNVGNVESEIVQVVYITTQPKNDLPTHVTIHSAKQISTALCEQVWTISQGRVGDYVGRITEDEINKIDKALSISLGITTTQCSQVVGIDSSGDDVLQLAANHVKEIMELAERRRKALEVYNSITDNTNVCLYQSNGLTQFGDLISQESMEQIKQSTIQAICNAKDDIAKQIKEKIEIKERKVAVINQDFEHAVKQMEEQHGKEEAVKVVKKVEKLEIEPGMKVEKVKELFWDKDYTIEKTAEVLGVKRSTLYTFICKHNLKKPKKNKPTKSGAK